MSRESLKMLFRWLGTKGLLVLVVIAILPGCLEAKTTKVTMSPAPKSSTTSTTHVPMKTVPSVVGLPLVMAKLKLAEAGFSVSTPGLSYGGNDREVAQQQPAGGAKVEASGSAVVSVSLDKSAYAAVPVATESSDSTTSSASSGSSFSSGGSYPTVVVPGLDPDATATTVIPGASVTTTTAVTSYTYATYTSAAFGYTVEYPNTWLSGSFTLEDLTLEFFTNMSLQGAGNNISIMAEDVPDTVDLDAYFAEVEGQIEVYGGSIETKTEAELSGMAAYRYDLPEMEGLKQNQIIAVDDGRAWAITFSASSSSYSNDLQVFDHMIETFQLPGSV